MSRAQGDRQSPRAVIHKRILDAVESRPNASVEVIADEISGATPDLVEKVLEEYGDPAAETASKETMSSDTATDDATETNADEQPTTNGGEPDGEPPGGETHAGDTTSDGEAASDEATDPVTQSETAGDGLDLTDKQRETLRAVHERPGASQEVIADMLDVSRATVSRRLNDIPDFEWSQRDSFTATVFESEPGTDRDAAESDTGTKAEADTSADAGTNADTGTNTDTGTSASQETDEAGDERPADEAGDERPAEESLGLLAERVDALEARLDEEQATAAAGETVTLPPDLAHKVIHACMESDRLSEEEELRLLEALLAG